MTPQVTEALVAAPGGQPQILSNQKRIVQRDYAKSFPACSNAVLFMLARVST